MLKYDLTDKGEAIEIIHNSNNNILTTNK